MNISRMKIPCNMDCAYKKKLQDVHSFQIGICDQHLSLHLTLNTSPLAGLLNCESGISILLAFHGLLCPSLLIIQATEKGLRKDSNFFLSFC